VNETEVLSETRACCGDGVCDGVETFITCPDCGASDVTRQCVTEVSAQGGWYGGPWLWDGLTFTARHYEEYPQEGDRMEVLEGPAGVHSPPGVGYQAGMGDHGREWQYNKVRILTGRAAGIVGYAASKSRDGSVELYHVPLACPAHTPQPIHIDDDGFHPKHQGEEKSLRVSSFLIVILLIAVLSQQRNRSVYRAQQAQHAQTSSVWSAHARGGVVSGRSGRSRVRTQSAMANVNPDSEWAVDPVSWQRRQLCGMIMTILAFGILFGTLSVSGSSAHHGDNGQANRASDDDDGQQQEAVIGTIAAWFSLTVPVLIACSVAMAIHRRRAAVLLHTVGVLDAEREAMHDVEAPPREPPPPLAISTMCVIQNPGDDYALGEPVAWVPVPKPAAAATEVNPLAVLSQTPYPPAAAEVVDLEPASTGAPTADATSYVDVNPSRDSAAP
jgi:hypothetical protein